MANSVHGINTNKAGTCPHGAPSGACPICSGMGGGGRVGERPQKAGEMSYHECAMIGAMMRAREAQQKLHEQTLLHRAELLKTFEQNLINAAQKISEFVSKIQNNILLKPVAFVLKNTVIPLLKAISNVTAFVSKVGEFIAQIKDKFIDIQDKLNAVFGEAKAFMEKKVSELITAIKTKFKDMFKVFKRNNTKDDETKIDEDKKIFRLKTFIQKILGRDKSQKDDTEN